MFNAATHARLLCQSADVPFANIWGAIDRAGIGLFNPSFTDDIHCESFRIANVLSRIFLARGPVVDHGH